jgi:hypothetical protein
MKAHELATITHQAIEKRNNERPAKLFAELLPKMKSQAESGYSHLDFVFSDPTEVVEQVLDLLREEGYSISKREKGIIRIGWEKAKADTQCIFDKCWVGKCKEPADVSGYCVEHRKAKCQCGRQATHDCEATIGAFVCGRLLCGRCRCHH